MQSGMVRNELTFCLCFSCRNLSGASQLNSTQNNYATWLLSLLWKKPRGRLKTSKLVSYMEREGKLESFINTSLSQVGKLCAAAGFHLSSPIPRFMLLNFSQVPILRSTFLKKINYLIPHYLPPPSPCNKLLVSTSLFEFK